MSSRTTQIARNSAFLLAAEAATKLGGVALLVVLARYFGPSQFGNYAGALALTSLLLVIADPGLSVLTTRDIARTPQEAAQRLGRGLFLKLFLSAAMVGAAFCASRLLGQPTDMTRVVLAVASGLAVGSLSTFVRALFRAFERMEYEAITRTAEQAIVVALGLAAVVAGCSLVMVAWSLVIGRLAGLVLTCAVCARNVVRPKFSRDVHAHVVLLVAGLPLALSGIFDSIVFYTDSVMLSALTGAVAVGLYNAALRPLAATLVLPAVLAAALLPRMSRDARADRPALATELGHSLKMVAAFALPVAAFVLPTAEGWIRLLFGAPYVAAAPAMGVLACAVAAVYVTTLTGHALVAADRQVVHLRLAAICATLNVGLNLLLIPRMGFDGAALASLASHLFMLSAELRAVRDLVDLKLLVRPMLKLGLSALMLFLAAHVMVMTIGTTTPRLLLLVTPLSCAVYLLCVAVLRVLDREEMATVAGLLRRLARPGR